MQGQDDQGNHVSEDQWNWHVYAGVKAGCMIERLRDCCCVGVVQDVKLVLC